MHYPHCLLSIALAALTGLSLASPQTRDLESLLLGMEPSQLATEARELGDARRGAIIFYQAANACTRCHIPDETANRLGPDLTALDSDVTDEHLIESILDPSKVIREGFESILLEVDGEYITGLLVSEDEARVTLRDSARDYKEVSFARDAIDVYEPSQLSVMPAGMVNVLTGKQQFLDLVSYLRELRDGGAMRAAELEPDPALYVARPVPAYEQEIDHAGLIREFDDSAFERGREIYESSCINCHGTLQSEGSLPTSLRFGSQPFKSGSDPHTMYRTLTHGFSMMVAQTWMVPTQKYDVIHYVREAYLKSHNPSQYFEVDEAYLAQLPEGDSRGPEPSETNAWSQMDYGPNQIMSLELGQSGTNIAYKGNAIRLDAGPGGVAGGRYWMLFDYDTLRVAAAWSGDEFIDWNSIHFNGKHNIHPRILGRVDLSNPTGPGWGSPGEGSFQETRLVGRDGRRYGPLDRQWAQYRGMYYHGPDTIIEYTVGATRILEMPGVIAGREQSAFTRTFNVGARAEDLVLQVAHVSDPQAALLIRGEVAFLGDLKAQTAVSSRDAETDSRFRFDGVSYLEVTHTQGLNAAEGDFTLVAHIQTKHDGTLVALTGQQQDWMPNGLTWFVRDGRLTLDIGWVGAFTGRTRIDDGKPHEVALAYNAATGAIQFYVDGKPDGGAGQLKREQVIQDLVLRVGYTARNFPHPSSFQGEFSELRFFNAVLDLAEIAVDSNKDQHAQLVAHWRPGIQSENVIEELRGSGRHLAIHRGRGQPGEESVVTMPAVTVAGVNGDVQGFNWSSAEGNLRLTIPAGDQPLRFTLWFGARATLDSAQDLAEQLVIDVPRRDLIPKTQGGPARWAQSLKSEVLLGEESGAFAVDVLRRPTDNPWFCRLRLTGIDFTEDGDGAIVSAWDGSVWKISGLLGLPASSHENSSSSIQVQWRRIASGLFQPLGVKILEGQIYIICRDQIVILHDLNGDEEIDWYECFNNDHQVTEHFHEFAMGLQSDAEGNLLYAKSARHALPALVPHHGTLLRVSRDGERTEIVANGFRAANGVCVNPDGSFFVTDQEGHWNPKNRINHVVAGGFYGNMYGYHDVTDESDEAMEPPLVWITNHFDRSPGELLWVDSDKWSSLNGGLLNLSYGAGQVFIVPHENVNGQVQGGMCALPLPNFPTGIMRGRFHPQDGQLYLAGMFAWAGNQQQPGGLYRLRHTGQPAHLPLGIQATKGGITLRFSDPLQAITANNPKNYKAKIWGLRRTKNYGSKHFDEHSLEVTAAELSADGKSVTLTIPSLAPTWGMEVKYLLKGENGEGVRGTIHNTIHTLQ